MMSKVILFGVLIFYSNSVVSVPYPEELIQRVYWPSNWSGNEHAQRQYRNEGFPPTHNQNHVKQPVRPPTNNQEYIDNQATRSSYNNVYNNNPADLPVPDKQILPHYDPPTFNRGLNPNQHIAPQDVPYPRNVDRSQININNEQLRNQNLNSHIQHPSSSYTNNQEQHSYIPPTVTNYRRNYNANPSLEYQNEAKENDANQEQIVRQTPLFRPNGPIPYSNLGVSNKKVSKPENAEYTEQNTSFSTQANNRKQVASEATEVKSNTASERKHYTHEPRKVEPYLIANHLAQRNENNNFDAHGTQASKPTQPGVLVNESRNRQVISKNVRPEPVNTYNTASEVTPSVAENNYENRRFIKINRSGSEYRIPVVPLNTYNHGPAKINYVETRNQQESVTASNYRESLPNDHVAVPNDAAVNNPENQFPVNTPKENRYRPNPIRQNNNSPRVDSSNLANKHQNIPKENNNNHQVASGLREFIPRDGYINEHHVLFNNLAHTDNKANSVNGNSGPDNIYNAAEEDKHFVLERKPENWRYTNNKNPGQAYRDVTTINSYDVPATSPTVVEKPNNVRHTEGEKLRFSGHDRIPAQNNNNLPVPGNSRATKNENMRHIGNVGGFQKPNYGFVRAPESLVYAPENTRHINDFRAHPENHHYEPVNTYVTAPVVVNHKEANNHESSRYIDIDRASFVNYPTPIDTVSAPINNVQEKTKEFKQENFRQVENYNHLVGNLKPSNTNNHSPAAEQIRSQVPNSRFTNDNVGSSNSAPSEFINDEAYNPENNRYIDDSTGLDYSDPTPIVNEQNGPTTLDDVENKNEEITYFDNESILFGPFKSYNDALKVLSEIDTDKHENQIIVESYGPVSPSRELDTNFNRPSPVNKISENIVNKEYKTDSSSSYKPEDHATNNINNGALNVPSDTVNSNAENPNLEHQLLTEEQNLKDFKDSSFKNHFVFVKPDGTFENLNNLDNKADEKHNSDIVVNNNQQDKIAEETFITPSSNDVFNSINGTTSPVPINTNINNNINNEFVNKDDQQNPPVEEIYKTQSQTVDNAEQNLIETSPPVPEKDTALPTNTNLPVNNNGQDLILPVTKDTEVNAVNALPVQSIENEPKSIKPLLPTEYTTVVATPYPYVTAPPSLELVTDNLYENLATTTESPITETSTVLENYLINEKNEVQNDNSNNSTPSVDGSQNYYTVNVTELTSEPHRINDIEEIATNSDPTRSVDKTDVQQIINQTNESPLDTLYNGDELTRDDEIINTGVISAIPDGLIETKQSPYGIKLVLDPSTVSEDDTITIAIELSDALDGHGSKGGVQVFNISPRNGADGYSNEILSNHEDYPTINGKPTVWLRAQNDHNIRNYDSEIEPYPVYLVPMEPQPVMEKETHITQYPNGTIVTVITEITYDNQEGTPPKITRTEKISEPKDQ